MKVGIVCPYDLAAPGGVQQVCRQLSDRLTGTGDEVVLAAPGTGAWVSAGPVVPVTANGSRVPLSVSLAATRRLEEAFEGVDVVHVHEPFIPVVGWASLRLEVPMVLTFHADPPAWARRLYERAPRPLAATVRSRVKTAVSEVAASALPAEWGGVRIIPNAIDVGAYAVDVPRRPGRVVFLGRDDPRKGLDVVLEAWPTVRGDHPEAELIVIGASRSNGPDGVQFVGRVREEEKRALLASAAVFVAPNLGGESFGIVVAEALAAGCAVAASDIPAFRAVAEHAATYVPPGDVGEWSEVLTTLLGSPDWMESLQRVARRHAARYDWSQVLSAYRTAYSDAVGSL